MAETILEENSTLIAEAQNMAASLPNASGTDMSLGVTGASVGDIIKVKAVDDSGKPTAWETEKTYSKTQIDAIMGSYVNDINALVGGDA